MTIEELQAEIEQLKKDLEHARSYKHTIKMRNRNLQAENERLKGELKNEKYSHERIREVKDVLKAENEKLKRELKRMEAQDQVVIDELRNENELLKDALKDNSQVHSEIEVNHIERINTCTATIKKLRNENAKLKCLALHAMSEYFYAKTDTVDIMGKKYVKYIMFATQYQQAYRKEKKDLKYGKID